MIPINESSSTLLSPPFAKKLLSGTNGILMVANVSHQRSQLGDLECLRSESAVAKSRRPPDSFRQPDNPPTRDIADANPTISRRAIVRCFLGEDPLVEVKAHGVGARDRIRELGLDEPMSAKRARDGARKTHLCRDA